MLTEIVSRLEAVGISARAAMAGTRGAAHAAARFAARPTLVLSDEEGIEKIVALPITALRLPPDTVADLRKLGFERIADLMATPRAPLTLRFGPEPARRLDQATGRRGEPIEPPDIIEAQQLFAEPIGAAETIARYVGKLVAKLCEELEARGLGARRVGGGVRGGHQRSVAASLAATQPVGYVVGRLRFGSSRLAAELASRQIGRQSFLSAQALCTALRGKSEKSRDRNAIGHTASKSFGLDCLFEIFGFHVLTLRRDNLKQIASFRDCCRNA